MLKHIANLKESKVLELEKSIMDFGYNKNDFVIKKIKCEDDNTNDGFSSVYNVTVAIPKKFSDAATKVSMNFSRDKIKLLDKDDNVLITTADKGYSDVVKPTFFVA